MNQPRNTDGTFRGTPRVEKDVDLPSVSGAVSGQGFVPPAVLDAITKKKAIPSVSESMEETNDRPATS